MAGLTLFVMLKLVLLLLGSLLFAEHVLAESPSDACSLDAVYRGPTLRTALDGSSYPTRKINRSQSISNKLANRLDQSFFELVGSRTKATSASIALWSEDHGFWTADFGTHAAGVPNAYWWASGRLCRDYIVIKWWKSVICLMRR